MLAACQLAPDRVTAALADYDIRTAVTAIWDVVDEANRYVELAEPWRLASAERAGDASAGLQLDAALGVLIAACRTLAAELAPFIPGLAARLADACDDSARPAAGAAIAVPADRRQLASGDGGAGLGAAPVDRLRR